mmetsp:Transcript_14011/g.32689  ORF Transcript_14011/g.32689 Transcript_14011/m.32689 type:complete len:587 (+) Transcript_14011:216-1976(+)
MQSESATTKADDPCESSRMLSSPRSSSLMESLLKKSDVDWDDFLETIWETKCHRFVFHKEKLLPGCSGDIWNEIVDRGWDVLTHLMDNAYRVGNESSAQEIASTTTSSSSADPPLLFRDLQPMDDPEEINRLYNNSLYSAYLAGTSIVWNHVDLKSPRVATLCEDLQGGCYEPEEEQKSRSSRNGGCFFPHAYANAYLTPPHSQTVPPHADDRDVLVFQLVGHKRWKVYQERPIRHPYTHEQVGKSGIEVPQSVLDGPLAFDGCLQQGDVLYIPRGMVHEAKTTTDNEAPDLSFHITVALATHDWTLGGNLSRLIQTTLLNSVVLQSSVTTASAPSPTSTLELRRSLLPAKQLTVHHKQCEEHKSDDSISSTNGQRSAPLISHPCGGFMLDTEAIQVGIDNIFEMLRAEITAKSLVEDLNHRISTHNLRASEKRRALITVGEEVELRSEPKASHNPMDFVVGTIAAKNVSLDSYIRASTPIEREYAQSKFQAGGSSSAGLNVRDEIGDDVAEIITKIKTQKPEQNTTFRVAEFPKLLSITRAHSDSLVCNLTSLSLAKRAVELGAFAIVEGHDTESERITKRKRII